MAVSKVISFAFIIASYCISVGFSQFYVSPAPHYQHVLPYHQVHHQTLAYQIPYQAIAPQAYHQVVTAPAPVPALAPLFQQTYNTFPQRSNQVEASRRAYSEQNANSNSGSEYGFGYRTQYDDGATSMVIFVTGPESQKVNFARNSQATAKNLASNIFNANSNDQKHREIDNALSETQSSNAHLSFENLIHTFPVFKSLETPQTNVLHLYNHPANVFPLSGTTSGTTTTVAPASSTSSMEFTESDHFNTDDTESVTVNSSDNSNSRSNEHGGEEIEFRMSNFESKKSNSTSTTSSTTTTESANSTEKEMESTTSH